MAYTVTYDHLGNPTYHGDFGQGVGDELMQNDPMAQLKAVTEQGAARRKQQLDALEASRLEQQQQAYAQGALARSQVQNTDPSFATGYEDDIGDLSEGFIGSPYPENEFDSDDEIGLAIDAARKTRKQRAADREARSVDFALSDPGPDTVGGGPGVQPASPQQVAVPAPTEAAEPVQTVDQMNADWAKSQIRRQMVVPGVIGALQIASAFWKTDAEKEARRIAEEFKGGSPEKERQKAQQRVMEEGTAKLNLEKRRAGMAMRDLAANMPGQQSARDMRAINDAIADAYMGSEAELVAAANAAGVAAQDKAITVGMQALQTVAQIQTSRMKAVFDTVTSFAPVLAKLHVAKGVEQMSTQVESLPPEWQSWFYENSVGASRLTGAGEAQRELGRLYAYAQKQTEAGGTPESPAQFGASTSSEGV
jgi:hypothetical protein